MQKLREDGRYALRVEADWGWRSYRQSQLAGPAEAGRPMGSNYCFPTVQQAFGLRARALQVRFRAEIAQCRFDDAIRTAKTMFAHNAPSG